MSGKTRIFISSTCYDLTDIRDSIQHDLQAIGHEVMISDSTSFPVGFNRDPIETCKHNITHNTDIFVLIIGSRAGWTDARFDRTVVNIEYDTAKNAGLDILAFARQPLLDLLPHWKENHEYSVNVDSPLVYKLLNNVQIDGYWIKPLERGSNLVEILKEQLSAHLKRLIVDRKAGKFKQLPEFEHESPRAKQIVMERPKYWEFLLQEELLRTKFEKIKKTYDDLERGIAIRKSRRMGTMEFVMWVQDSMTDWINIINSFAILLSDELQKSVGPPGVPGNPVDIQATIDKIIECGNAMLEWETDLKFFILSDECEELRSELQWATKPTLTAIGEIREGISGIFRVPNPDGMHEIKLTVTMDWNLETVSAAIERLRASM
jgi:hypothetical protein